jgi:hypothetical protein
VLDSTPSNSKSLTLNILALKPFFHQHCQYQRVLSSLKQHLLKLPRMRVESMRLRKISENLLPATANNRFFATASTLNTFVCSNQELQPQRITL